MKRKQLLVTLLFAGLQTAAFGQNGFLYGLLRKPSVGNDVSSGQIFLTKLDPNTDTFTQLSQTSLAPAFNLTGAALNPYSQEYYFESFTTFLSVNMLDGLPIAQNTMSNPIAPSYFDNFRFNPSDSTIYGLARRTTSTGIGQANGELYLAKIDPATAVITQISPQSVGQIYAGISNAINPHEMVYYYSTQTAIVGLDIYTGQIYSSQTITFPQGGMFIDNYTYNCADTTIYGLVRMNTAPPLTFYLGKINPQTGVVSIVSQQPLPYPMYSANGSSTIDPVNGVYYFAASLPGPEIKIIGVSVTTGAVVSESTVPTLNGSILYYDMMRHSADCFEAAAIRENPNANSAGLTQVQQGSVKVAPNPFEQLLTVTAKAPIQALTLRDSQGKVVLQTHPAAQSVELQTAHLQSGVYFLEVQSTNGIELVKVVK
jgi:hypothetical protein